MTMGPSCSGLTQLSATPNSLAVLRCLPFGGPPFAITRRPVLRLRSSVACNSTDSSGVEATNDADAPQAGGEPAAAATSAPAPSGKKAFTISKQYRRKHTLGAVYLGEEAQSKFEEIDHHARRIERDIKEIAESGRRLGLSEEQVRENLEQLRVLLPGLMPNLHRMKASEWAQVVANVQDTAAAIITFKSLYQGVDLLKVVAATPRLLLKEPAQMQDDARKVRQVLRDLEEAEFDAVVEAVPYLVDPSQLVQSLSNLATWFPNQDPIEMLKKDPTKLINVEESTLEADPLYGDARGRPQWAKMD